MDLLITVTILAAIGLAFGIGANDETFSPVVGSGTLTARNAAILGGILAIFGTLFLSTNVGKTVGTGLLTGEIQTNYDPSMLLAIVLATAILLVVGSILGLPLSTTHVIVGAVIGIAIAYSAIRGVTFTTYLNGETFFEVILGWILSPILGYFGAWSTYAVMRKILYSRIKGLDAVDKSEQYTSYALLVTIIITQLSRGGNDSAKATSILYWFAASGAISPFEVDVSVVIIAIALGGGLFILGRKILRRVGTSLIELRPSSAFSLQLFVAIILTVSTLLGIPISGTHTLVFAMLGLRRGQKLEMDKPQRRSLLRIIIGWVATFPVGAATAAGLYYLFGSVF